MKAVVVRQPWATLIALGIKTIETRPSPPNGPMRPKGVRGLPGCSLERGERIAIVAGAAAPSAYALGEFDICQHASETCHVMDGWPVLTRGDWYMYRRPNPPGMVRRAWLLPLGAVVCTVTVEDALRMEPCPPRSTSFDDRWESPRCGAIYIGGLDGGPWLFDGDGNGPFPLAHQLPYGDFTEGRWGWLLGDPQPPTKQCPFCGGSGLVERAYDCGFCTDGRVPCEPIPVKGQQGVFELPADVAEVLR